MAVIVSRHRTADLESGKSEDRSQRELMFCPADSHFEPSRRCWARLMSIHGISIRMVIQLLEKPEFPS